MEQNGRACIIFLGRCFNCNVIATKIDVVSFNHHPLLPGGNNCLGLTRCDNILLEKEAIKDRIVNYFENLFKEEYSRRTKLDGLVFYSIDLYSAV